MQSLPDGPSGDPVLIHGYYLEPQDGKKHPVIMHYYGYDDLHPSSDRIFCPTGSSDYAEFYLSTRGQIINNRKADQRSDGIDMDFSNTYGDWFAFNFGQRDAYYYRGAFMDCVQGIRFMATRACSDMNNVFAEGKSQGGAFSYAAAALSPYPLRAIAPGVAFLGDFPDYFQIVDWPANVAKQKKGSMSDEEMYRFLSYFDTKNLATRIQSAVMANICLQDVTCPPHSNIAPFNNLSNPDKEVYFYPLYGHDIPAGWDSKFMAFFKKHVVN
jgi:cephalosporin-C deacetylase